MPDEWGWAAWRRNQPKETRRKIGPIAQLVSSTWLIIRGSQVQALLGPPGGIARSSQCAGNCNSPLLYRNPSPSIWKGVFLAWPLRHSRLDRESNPKKKNHKKRTKMNTTTISGLDIYEHGETAYNNWCEVFVKKVIKNEELKEILFNYFHYLYLIFTFACKIMKRSENPFDVWPQK